MFQKKPKIGDIFEIKTPSGFAYLQYTHEGGGMGELVRVLPGLFSTRPKDFGELAKRRELYFAFYTLKYAFRARQTETVSHQPVPEWAQAYPFLRWPAARDQGGKTLAWKIFKASDPLTVETHQRTPVIRTLTPDQERLSIHQLWPHPIMVKQLARGWTPERAEELRMEDVAEGKARRAGHVPERKDSEPMNHYLYFPKKPNAEEAGEWLRRRGFSVEVRKGADGENWLTLARRAPPETGEQMDELRDEMETLAAQFGGEYDGWEGSFDSCGSESVEKSN
jgi:hypothetical protein